MQINFESFEAQTLVVREKTGTEYNSLYAKYYTRLVFYLNKIVKDEYQAEDIATDTFLSALNQIDKYDPTKAQFSTWVFKIGHNLALQYIKNKKTLSMDSVIKGMDADNPVSIAGFLRSDNSVNLRHDIASEKVDVLINNITIMREPFKTILTMREIDKMSYACISEKLDMNLSTVKSQIRNGRIILANMSRKDIDQINLKYDSQDFE